MSEPFQGYTPSWSSPFSKNSPGTASKKQIWHINCRELWSLFRTSAPPTPKEKQTLSSNILFILKAIMWLFLLSGWRFNLAHVWKCQHIPKLTIYPCHCCRCPCDSSAGCQQAAPSSALQVLPSSLVHWGLWCITLFYSSLLVLALCCDLSRSWPQQQQPLLCHLLPRSDFSFSASPLVITGW